MICHAGADQGWAVSTSNPPFHAENGGSTLSSCSLSVHFRCGGLSCSLRIGKSYTAIFEINTDKLHRGGRASHRSTRIICGYYTSRASQVGGRPFSAQELEQNCFAVRGRIAAMRLLRVATESRMFSLELLLLCLKLVYSS